MTMNVMNVKSEIEVKSQRKEIGPKDGETFSGILSASMKAKSSEEKPKAKGSEKLEKNPAADQIEAEEENAEEKVSADKDSNVDVMTVVPFNLMTEITAPKNLSVEETEIPVDGLRTETEKSSEIPAVLTGMKEAESAAEGKISHLMNLSKETEAPDMKEGKAAFEEADGETLPEDFLAKLNRISEKTEPSKVSGENKPALNDEIGDETLRTVSESKGKGKLSEKNPGSEMNEEMAKTAKETNSSEKMIIPQLQESSESLEKKPVKPETEGTLSSDDNIVEMHVEKSSSAVKAAPVRESVQKSDFTQNLEKATDEILRSMETMKDGDRTTMKLKLHPEELGKMEITLTLTEGRLSGKILLDNHEAKQLFNQKIDELSETLSKNNVQVARFEVGIGEKQAGNQARQESGRHMQAQNPFKGYLSQRKDETAYEMSTVQRTLEGIDLLA